MSSEFLFVLAGTQGKSFSLSGPTFFSACKMRAMIITSVPRRAGTFALAEVGQGIPGRRKTESQFSTAKVHHGVHWLM